MAARLTVVISQASIRDGRAADLEESLVTRLMLTSGMDATLVGPLEHLEPNSTDFLCLSSFGQAIALLSWLDREQVAHHWQRLGLEGEVFELGEHGQPRAEGAKRVYHLPLTAGTGVETAVEQLETLLKDRNVKTVGIAVPPNGASSASTEPDNPISSARPTAVPQAKVPPAGAQLEKPPATAERAPSASQDSLADDEEWAELDRLVDDFEALDL